MKKPFAKGSNYFLILSFKIQSTYFATKIPLLFSVTGISHPLGINSYSKLSPQDS